MLRGRYNWLFHVIRACHVPIISIIFVVCLASGGTKVNNHCMFLRRLLTSVFSVETRFGCHYAGFVTTFPSGMFIVECADSYVRISMITNVLQLTR